MDTKESFLYYSSSLPRPAINEEMPSVGAPIRPHVAVEDTKKSLAKLKMRQISARSVPWLKACPFLEGRFVTLSALIVTASDAADDSYLVGRRYLVSTTYHASNASLIKSGFITRAVSGSRFLLSISHADDPNPYPCGSGLGPGYLHENLSVNKSCAFTFLQPVVPSDADRAM